MYDEEVRQEIKRIERSEREEKRQQHHAAEANLSIHMVAVERRKKQAEEAQRKAEEEVSQRAEEDERKQKLRLWQMHCRK